MYLTSDLQSVAIWVAICPHNDPKIDIENIKEQKYVDSTIINRYLIFHPMGERINKHLDKL